MELPILLQSHLLVYDPASVHVHQYLERIRADARGGASSETLRHLHERHLLTVPFENLDIHNDIPIVLDPGAIVEKVVLRRRGGFCYELNAAFAWLLMALGYEVTLLAAEVARPEGGFGIPFDHLTLRVTADGRDWLADVGFGDSFRYPLALELDRVHEESEFTFRLIRRDEHWHLERAPFGTEDFTAQYRFTLTPRALEDFQSGCRYHQTSPESTFTQKRVVSIALPDGRVTLGENGLLLRRSGERVETALENEAEWNQALKQYFGIRMEDLRCRDRS